MSEGNGRGLKLRLRRIAGQIDSQHRHLAEFRSDLLAAAGRRGAEAVEACARYQRSLEAHFELEEERFFPALHGYAPEEAAALRDLEREHDALREALQGVHAAIAAGARDAVATLERFLTQLHDHERAESELWRHID